MLYVIAFTLGILTGIALLVGLFLWGCASEKPYPPEDPWRVRRDPGNWRLSEMEDER